MIAARIALLVIASIALVIVLDRLLRLFARAVRRAPMLDAASLDRGCHPMTRGDQRAVSRAIRAVYRHARIEPPPRSHHIFVQSPLTAAIAFGLAEGVWWLRTHPGDHVPIFGRPIDDDELLHALDDACERAVVRGAREIYGGQPRHVERLVAAARAAARLAVLPCHTTELPADGARVLYHAVRSMRLSATRRMTGTNHPGGEILRAPLLGEVDTAIGRVVRAAPETTRDVAGFLLDRLHVWWRPRSPMREDLADIVRLASTIDASMALRVPGWSAIATLAGRAGPHFLHPAFWIVSDRPTEVHRDDRLRAHRDRGVAIAWRDGWGLPYLHGVPVALRHVSGPPSLDAIRDERNAEVRRVLIERYERGDRYRYFADAGAEVLDQDRDRAGLPRRLLRVRYGDDDEPFVALELTNTTPEPDGSHRRYLLRVPPGMRTCQAAVAWTFGLAAEAYQPDDES